MIRRQTAVAALVAAGLGVSAGQAAGAEGVTRVEVMAKSCLACHGAQGQGPGHMPAIKDFTAEGIVNKLMTYRRDGDPDATVMQRHAAGYTEDEIRAIAQYIANLDQ
jgi:sulfide dehydrogenase cytochrome subunit